MNAYERIILALDVDTEQQALDLVEKLAPHVGAFKVGMQLFNSAGPGIVGKINDLGGKVFADLKFHDIPNTVGAAGRVMTRLNVFMFNVHAAGGKEMLQTVVKEVQNEASRLNRKPPLVIAVTVLTSIAQEQLAQELLIPDLKVEDVVVRWAQMAEQTGIDGVVCSPKEINAIRSACRPEFKIITPGIRPAWSEANDQKRITTPRAALDMGADYMVIGRPITKAPDPVAAAQRIIEELEG
ncbi:MAG TPA: orotidine-5'-phosphate decarboxylase [Syntrophomonas sp.]|jgi:orotidine-5'-phosphate decarboxylase|nr:orotidine-5'-phosphate decarboxylase [Syntrophomonas sp.]HCF71194.1 orotidine-5'-phosphate decarboxylase [Syntrophomonas sp.]